MYETHLVLHGIPHCCLEGSRRSVSKGVPKFRKSTFFPMLYYRTDDVLYFILSYRTIFTKMTRIVSDTTY
jgi:hypothetical protein